MQLLLPVPLRRAEEFMRGGDEAAPIFVKESPRSFTISNGSRHIGPKSNIQNFFSSLKIFLRLGVVFGGVVREPSMRASRSILFWFCFAISLVAGGAYWTVAESYAQKLLGGVEVKGEKTEGSLSQRLPGTIYVADFALDAENYVPDEGVRGVSPGRLGKRLPRLLQKDNPAERARQIVETMADSLVQHLKAKGLQAQRLRNTAGDLPREGWLVQGVFTELDEGNRLKRAGIGFGKGATSMDVQVGISDLAGSDPRAAFLLLGTVKDPSRIPGAVVTMNPYVAAAKFVLQKNATERDIQRTAAQIVEEILKYEQQIKEKTTRPTHE